MVHQTQINGRPGGRRAGTVLRANVVGLLHDVISLAELQAQLVALDLREVRQRSVVPLGMMLAGALLALGAVPVLLLSIGWALVNLAGLSAGAAFAVTAGTSLVIAAALAWAGWRMLNAAVATLCRSQQEWSSNVRWIKRALNRSSSNA